MSDVILWRVMYSFSASLFHRSFLKHSDKFSAATVSILLLGRPDCIPILLSTFILMKRTQRESQLRMCKSMIEKVRYL